MKPFILLGAVLLVAPVAMPPAFAAGCLKGAAVGGVVGHEAGRHGVAGAAVGCVVGRHEANKAAKDAPDHPQR